MLEKRGFGVAFVAFVVLIFSACSNHDGSGGDSLGQSRLPDDPSEWVCASSLAGATQEEIDAWCAANPDRGEPLPARLRVPPPLSQLEEKNLFDEDLEAFVKAESYKLELGWFGDETWRFTGPYVGEIGSGYSYGTHLPVRIYYSPEVIDWLCDGREGDLPPGAMIVKEMTLINQNLDVTIDDEGCMVINADATPLAWAMMIKRGAESNDEWYWPIMQRSSFPLYPEERVDPPVVDRSGFPNPSFVPANPTSPDSTWYPTGYYSESTGKIPNIIDPQNNYGSFCIACHASAAEDSTFASLDNVLGDSIAYKLFPTAPGDTVLPFSDLGTHVLALTTAMDTTANGTYDTPFQTPLDDASATFLAFYDQLDEVSFSRVWDVRLPAQTYDHVVAATGGADSFLTSDQCAGCHDTIDYLADTSNMIVEDEKNGETQVINLSPVGEWEVSPMGVAGRDPIFFAQLESETNNLPDLTECIENTCLHCHGVMGQRQLAADTAGGDACLDFFAIPPPAGVPVGEPFRLEMVSQWPGSTNDSAQKYGALARDGISCTVCHRIAQDALGTEASFTGNFLTGPTTELYGPYEDVVTVAMENALGVTPSFAEQIASADLCGSCHNILLPVFDNDGTKTGFSYEQTTHLEWLNSDYAPGRSRAKTCQDCHMPTEYDGEPLSFEIANFESSQYPPTTNRIPDSEITLTERDPFARHSLHGVNLFLNQMFQQFPLLLGFRQSERFSRTRSDYPPLLLGQDSMVDMAQEQTASIAIDSLRLIGDGELQVVVDVTNRTGHYLPSGVGFRRMFIELLVRDADDAVLWASGRTNELGLLLQGTTDEVLASEQPLAFPMLFQPHYQVITADDQVQIYEEIVEDSDGNRTTSFLRRFRERKDNRIRPDGYDPHFYDSFDSPYIRALAVTPGEAANDPSYTNPERTGADQIEYRVPLSSETLERVDHVDVALYYQSIPPPYLQERFRDASRGPAQSDHIERLYYMSSHLQTDGIVDGDGRQVMESWKILLTNATQELGG